MFHKTSSFQPEFDRNLCLETLWITELLSLSSNRIYHTKWRLSSITKLSKHLKKANLSCNCNYLGRYIVFELRLYLSWHWFHSHFTVWTWFQNSFNSFQHEWVEQNKKRCSFLLQYLPSIFKYTVNIYSQFTVIGCVTCAVTVTGNDSTYDIHWHCVVQLEIIWYFRL